jgi:hypothetical protein
MDCIEQAMMVETDPAKSRAAAGNYMGMYLRMPGSAYRRERDFAGDLSDRLAEAIVAWGS